MISDCFSPLRKSQLIIIQHKNKSNILSKLNDRYVASSEQIGDIQNLIDSMLNRSLSIFGSYIYSLHVKYVANRTL